MPARAAPATDTMATRTDRSPVSGTAASAICFGAQGVSETISEVLLSCPTPAREPLSGSAPRLGHRPGVLPVPEDELLAALACGEVALPAEEDVPALHCRGRVVEEHLLRIEVHVRSDGKACRRVVKMHGIGERRLCTVDELVDVIGCVIREVLRDARGAHVGIACTPCVVPGKGDLGHGLAHGARPRLLYKHLPACRPVNHGIDGRRLRGPPGSDELHVRFQPQVEGIWSGDAGFRIRVVPAAELVSCTHRVLGLRGLATPGDGLGCDRDASVPEPASPEDALAPDGALDAACAEVAPEAPCAASLPAAAVAAACAAAPVASCSVPVPASADVDAVPSSASAFPGTAARLAERATAAAIAPPACLSILLACL